MRVLRVAAIAATTLLLAASCAAKGDEPGGEAAEEGEVESAEGSQEADLDTFGEMDSPCGEGDLRVDASEGHTEDALRIGVANDRSSNIRPGLNKEIWDASNAFVQWCNDQGGIGGLPIEIIDMDGKLLEVESAMTTACADAFMMVGGGFVQDNLEFSGKQESDFHLCGMADIPALAASPEKSSSNGQILPLPRTASEAPNGWAETMLELEPQKASAAALVWGDIPTMETIKEQDQVVLDSVGTEIDGEIIYPVTGMSDWTPLARQIIETEAGTAHILGEPTNIGSIVKTLREQGWDGVPVFQTNLYDQQYVKTAGAEAAAGSVIRTLLHPFEEADEWPAIEEYLEIMDTYEPDGKKALLGLHSFSAWLLFATAANGCGEANDGLLTRDCVLTAAADVDEWTGGGLHVQADPGPQGGEASTCILLLTVAEDGSFERLHPEVGSDDDDGAGFHCNGELLPIPANADLGVVDPDRAI